MKNIAHFCFQGLENQKTLESFCKEEEEQVQENVQRDSKVVKEYVEKLFVNVVSSLQM